MLLREIASAQGMPKTMTEKAVIEFLNIKETGGGASQEELSIRTLAYLEWFPCKK